MSLCIPSLISSKLQVYLFCYKQFSTVTVFKLYLSGVKLTPACQHQSVQQLMLGALC